MLINAYTPSAQGNPQKPVIALTITRQVHAYVGEAKYIPAISERHDHAATIFHAENYTEANLIMAVQDLIGRDLDKVAGGLLEAEVPRDSIYNVFYVVGLGDDPDAVKDEECVCFSVGSPASAYDRRHEIRKLVAEELLSGESADDQERGLIPLVARYLRPGEAAQAGQLALKF